MQTIPTPAVHSENEHAIVALFSDASVRQAVAIQEQLVQIFGDAIWLQQPPALHITLMEIICNAEYKDISRQEHFRRWYEAYNQIVPETLADLPPCSLTFNELHVSQRAIIIKAADPAPLNDIRAQLLARISLPQGTKTPPDIAHSTLARFNTAIDLEGAVYRTRKIAVNIVEPIKEFSLVKDLGPPDFNGTPMQTYPLGAKLPAQPH